MGTCLDWHSSISKLFEAKMKDSLGQNAPASSKISEESSKLALAWRNGFFLEIQIRFEAGEESEDIDETHRRVLTGLIESPDYVQWSFLSDADREDCVQAWHRQLGRSRLSGASIPADVFR